MPPPRGKSTLAVNNEVVGLGCSVFGTSVRGFFVLPCDVESPEDRFRAAMTIPGYPEAECGGNRGGGSMQGVSVSILNGQNF